MKKVFILMILIAGIYTAHAQVNVSVNLGVQPLWGPTGYDYVEYYYIPDLDMYYDVPSRRYVYLDNGAWVHTYSLPPRYRGYDMYGAYKVVVNERDPWIHHDRYRTQYVQYRGRHGQGVIRDSRDSRYFNGRPHPQPHHRGGAPGHRPVQVGPRGGQPGPPHGGPRPAHDNGHNGPGRGDRGPGGPGRGPGGPEHGGGRGPGGPGGGPGHGGPGGGPDNGPGGGEHGHGGGPGGRH